MMRRSNGIKISILLAASLNTAAALASTESPEKQTARIARALRPVSDLEWNKIAGNQVVGNYEITRGDSLYDISKRLFGDGKYWPKIWALNNTTILNPHLIRPGNRIVFAPGTGTSLPAVEIATEESGEQPTNDAEPIPTYYKKPRSQEWSMLPPQPWEAERIRDELESRQELKVMGDLTREPVASLKNDLRIFVTSTELRPLGHIDSSPVNNSEFRIGDQVVISGDELAAGETYAIVSPSTSLKRGKSSRDGYIYQVLGEIQLNRSQDQDWIGTVSRVFHFVERGAALVPKVSPIGTFQPIAAASPTEGHFFFDSDSYTFQAQYQIGFVDLGSDDGISTGMIFESFDPKDGETGSLFKDQQLFHVSDMQVIQVSEQFSMVEIIGGSRELPDGTPVKAMTDVSRFTGIAPSPTPTTTAEPEPLPEPSPEVVPAPSPEPSQVPSPEPSLAPSPEPSPEPLPPPSPLPEPTPSPEPVIAPAAPAPEVTPPPTSPMETQPAEIPPAPETPPPPQAPQAEEQPKVAPKNELDDLDQSEEALSKSEQKELMQLENYKDKVSSSQAVEKPTEDLPPPPPADNSPKVPAPEELPPAQASPAS